MVKNIKRALFYQVSFTTKHERVYAKTKAMAMKMIRDELKKNPHEVGYLFRMMPDDLQPVKVDSFILKKDSKTGRTKMTSCHRRPRSGYGYLRKKRRDKEMI